MLKLKMFAMLPVCALVLSACGGGSDDASDATSAQSASSTQSSTLSASTTAAATTAATTTSGTTAATTAASTTTAAATTTAKATAATTTAATTTAATAAATTVAAATTTAATTSVATATSATTTSAGTLMGVNIHPGTYSTSNNQAIANVVGARNFKTARTDFGVNWDVNGFRDMVTRLNAAGVKVEVSLQNSYQWDYSCNQNLSAVESDSYNQTVTLVQQVGDLVKDFELLNEVMLRPDTSAQVTPFQGTPASGYAGKSCYSTMVSVLRGMSRAIVDQRNATGRAYRVILGTVSNNFGFLDFMAQNGVTFDVTGYHIYPHAGDALVATDPWFGSGGLMAQLARFGRPVHINEFNCGETYDSGFDNIASSVETNLCLAGIQKQLASLMSQSTANLESVHAYELLDEPSKAAPENHFGLMYDINTPKLQLALYSTFAGGSVSTAEKTLLSALGLKGL